MIAFAVKQKAIHEGYNKSVSAHRPPMLPIHAAKLIGARARHAPVVRLRGRWAR
jgi:hypothetical protein